MGSASAWIANHARIVIAVMVVASALVAVGIPMVDRSTSLDQFQTDADEADALEYVDANFTGKQANTTSAQVIVQDEDVLDRETLLAILEYEQRLQTNETINATLVENDSTQSVANLIATASIREDRAQELRTRERTLAETEKALAASLDSLAANPNASVSSAFEAVDATTSVNLTADDYARFADAVGDRRGSLDENATAAGTNETSGAAGTNETSDAATNETSGAAGTNETNGAATNETNDTALKETSVAATTPTTETATNQTGTAAQTVTGQILAEEYEALAEDRQNLTTLDPSLGTQLDELRSLNDSQVEGIAADVLAGNTSQSARALAFMPDYYEPGSTTADATLVVVTQESGEGSFAPGDAPADIEDSQAAMAALAPTDGVTSVLLYGDGIVSAEITDSMIDSVLLVGPLALGFVLLVLVVVYRDFLDVLLGLLGIALVLAWTFGAMGWFDIAFSQPFIVVLVLLIGLSIDYGLHVVMRYREAREGDEAPEVDEAREDDEAPEDPDAPETPGNPEAHEHNQSSSITPRRAMAIGLGSVGVALIYVTTTTVIGFLSNLTSPLAVFRDLGVVSAIGIVAALLIFGLLVPALKVELDTVLESRGVDRAQPAVGTGAGPINRFLATGTTLATKAPYVVIVLALVVSGVGVYGATDIDASFEQSDFLAEDPADWLKDLPEPFAPGTYSAATAIETLDDDFVRKDTTATILVRGDVTDPATLDRLDAARQNASGMSATETYADGEAAISDPITVMDRVAADNESFNRTLTAADTDGDGVPEENVTAVYDELFRVAPDAAGDVIYRSDGGAAVAGEGTGDGQRDGTYRAIRMVITIDGGVDDGTVRDQMEWVAADLDGAGVTTIATGDVIVNGITADQLAETAFLSLVVALLSVLVVLAVAYRVTEGSASLGVVTIVPVAFTLTWVLGTMALLGIPFNIVTGMITGLTIGLGVDYSLHVSERFNQELRAGETVGAALEATMTGTGGALLSSAATTASGFAVLLVAILPFLQSFGLITALTIVFAFLASVFVLPSLLVVWARLVGRAPVTEADSGVEMPETGPTASRTIHRSYALPEESIPVTVSLRGLRNRVSIRETVPGELARLDVAPEPVALQRRDGSVTVFWDVGEGPSEASLEYTVDLAGETRDGEQITFEGIIEDEDGTREVGGDEVAVVVEDVFQRVLERGTVSDADLEIAVEDDDVTPTAVDRLRRIWLGEE